MVVIPPASEKMLADNVGLIKVDSFPAASRRKSRQSARSAKTGSEEARSRSPQLRPRAMRMKASLPRTCFSITHNCIFAGQKFPRQLSMRPEQGHYESSCRSPRQSWNRRTAEIVAAAIPGERSRRCHWRKDFRRWLGHEADRNAQQRGPDSFHREILSAEWQGGHSDASVTPNVIVAEGDERSQLARRRRPAACARRKGHPAQIFAGRSAQQSPGNSEEPRNKRLRSFRLRSSVIPSPSEASGKGYAFAAGSGACFTRDGTSTTFLSKLCILEICSLRYPESSSP